MASAIGLDIGTSGVRAAEVSLGKEVTLEHFGQVSLPPGAVRDGEINDPAMVAGAIAQLWRLVKFRGKKVTVGVANQKVVVRPIDLPFMEMEELRGAIQFQVQEYIPIPVEEAILDFQVLEEFVTENNERMMRVLLVAAQKDMINMFVETVQRAGLDPVAVDHVPFALIRSLGAGSGALGPAAGEALIEVGAGITNIVVHEGGIPRFARTLLVGGVNLTEALAAGLGVSFEAAEETKQRMGLAATPSNTMASPEPAPRILEERSGELAEEIRGSLDYYLAQTDATRISRVVVSGGGSKLTNLASRLSGALRLPVEPGHIFQRIRAGRKLGLSESQLMEIEELVGAAVGLALGEAE